MCQGSKQRLELAAVVGLALLAAPTRARAQELEPRAYSNSPIGTHFFISGFTYSHGGLSVDPSIELENAALEIHSGIFAYSRALNLLGKSGRIEVVLPAVHLSGTGTVAGQVAQRQASGFGDLRFRLSVNLVGAPALSVREFRRYKRDLVIGASVQLSVPSGDYDSSKAINLGTNRWSIRADFGFSKAFGALTLDVTASGAFYSDNRNYFGGKTLSQSPLFACTYPPERTLTGS